MVQSVVPSPMPGAQSSPNVQLKFSSPNIVTQRSLFGFKPKHFTEKQKLADVRLVASTANKRANDGPTKKEAIILMDADDIFEGMF